MKIRPDGAIAAMQSAAGHHALRSVLTDHLDPSSSLLRGTAKTLRAKMETLKQEEERLSSEADTLRKFVDWMRSGGFELQRATSTAYHKVVDTAGTGSMITLPRRSVEWRRFIRPDAKVIQLEHDWSAAFTGATDFDGGEFQLPFDVTVFEQQVSGRRVITVMFAPDDYCFFFQGPQWLYCGPPWGRDAPDTDAVHDVSTSMLEMVLSNVRAACIALEAQIVTAPVTRAPYRLNAAREKRGELPIFDHHTLKLSRNLVRPLPAAGEVDSDRRKPRLHFRRGHWRHYEAHKTWIKWTLVGNPDLGFVDKTYRL